MPEQSTAVYSALTLTSATVALLHTFAGPDHYVPFVAMARVGGWTLRKTIIITTLCGLAHICSSLALGAVGLWMGAAFQGFGWLDSFRGNIAGWLLIGFGLAYLSWGTRQAVLNRPHTHWHTHADGTAHAHAHTHVHQDEHLHVHDAAAIDPEKRAAALTPWILFAVFAFGPCEPLVPLMMGAATRGTAELISVTIVFSACTLAAMIACVVCGTAGLSTLAVRGFARYSHVLAGLAVFGCGLAIQAGY